MPVTLYNCGPYNKSRGRVPLCELAILAAKSNRKEKKWSLRLVPQIQTGLLHVHATSTLL